MDLVTKTVNDYKVEVVYNYIDKMAEEGSGIVESIVPSARKYLLSLTCLLEALRKCQIKQFVQIYSCDSNFPEVLAHNQDVYAAIRPSTLSSAIFSSAVALLHAYAKSYRLNVQVVRLINNGNFEDSALQSLYELGLKASNTKAVEISTFECSTKEESKTSSPESSGPLAARFLVYGADNWIGQQFTDLLNAQQIGFVKAVRRPGADTTDHIREEIVKYSPSHVVLILHQSKSASEDKGIDYAGAGSINLLHNLQDNLYSPWNLANICEKIGVHFTYFVTPCLYSHSTALQLQIDSNSMEHLKIDEWNGENRYSVTKNFADLSLNGFTKTLNAHFQLAFNEENVPQNFLYQIIKTNNQVVGEVNLVHPQPIKFDEIMAIVGVNDAEQTQKVEANDHTALDTSRIEGFGLVSSKQAIQQAYNSMKSTA
uniref:Uncharacterized protein n=1 Tax=Ditylenchus dipsaci TaxID=166011 RepID=A0A915DCQ0_9BILA